MRLNDDVALVASGGSSLSLTHKDDCNAYLVNCGEESVLIDTGTGLENEVVIRFIDYELKNKLTYILLTHHHADHIGGAAELKKYYGAKVIAPEKERKSIEEADRQKTGLDVAKREGYYPVDYELKSCAVDESVKKGDSFTISEEDIKVYDGAGHSYGGVCYYFSRKKMIFVGDLILHGGFINLQNIPGANVSKYAKSVTALEKLDVEQFYPGHGCFSIHNGKLHIDKASQAFRKLGIPPNFV